jgi:hypothetical protein
MNGEKPLSPDDRLRKTLRVGPWDTSPTLLYFHTPHEDLQKHELKGAALHSLRQCKAFRDEQVARWLMLFHCVEVDMGKSDAKAAERLGFKEGVVFSIIDSDLNVLASSKTIPESETVASFLKTTMKSESCKKWWTNVQTRIDEQKQALENARALVKQDKLKEALEGYRQVLNSQVRVGEFFDEAAKEFTKLERKAEQAK